jgi:hypothetical protein
MSAPSSDGRPSAFSDPPSTSRTLYSRGSGTYVDNGEGSSQRHSFTSGPNSARQGANGSQSQGADSPLARDAVEEQDFATRRQHVRRSGGFLLDSSFASSPRQRHAEDGRGKHSARHRDASTHDSHPGRVSPFSSPLSRQLQNDGHDAGDEGRRGHGRSNGELRIGKTRHHTLPAQAPVATPPRQTIDPNQLVHMALDLSESRRRNISAGPQLSPQSRASSGVQRDGNASQHGAGNSLKQHLNAQRRVSRNMSPMGDLRSPSRNMSSSVQRSGSMAFSGVLPTPPSAATLARCDKARAYIELRIEYLRLLESLPPLKPNANAPGNFIVSSSNMPGSPHAQLTRVPSYAGKQYDLGRPYNPLQYIRNRRSRARERRILDHAPSEFTDLELVHSWVDRVEEHARRPDYRRDDGILLPRLHDHHAADMAPTAPPKPHKGWVFCPEELLADAYWLEQRDNKSIIENRHGRIIFPPKEPQRADLLQPRASKEYPEKRRKSWVEGVTGATADTTTGDESDKGSERGRKRGLLPAFRSDSPRHGGHSRRGSRLRTTADSDTSDSDTGSGKRKRKPRIVVDEEHNTGPLALQLETLLKQQASETQTASPSIVSPDTPNKWGRDVDDLPESKISRDSLDVPRSRNGFVSMKRPGTFKMPPRSRTNATLSGDDIEPRSSLDDWDSTAPNSPLQKRFPHIGSDLSPPPSRGTSLTRKTKRSKLNPFHSHDTSEDHEHVHHYDRDIIGSDRKRGSRQTSDDTHGGGHVGHSIMAAPGAVKSLLSHRKNDSTVSLPSPDRTRRKDSQEPHSAVTRFFKGVKHEGSKVGGFVFRRDRPDDDDDDALSDRHTAEYDTDVSVKGAKTKRPAYSRTVTSVTVDSVASSRNDKYHLDLPEFRPAHEAQISEDGTLLTGDHISRQNRERKSSRSPRFDRLAPPKMDLERISTASSATSLGPSRSHNQHRINEMFSRPGAAGTGNLPPTGLKNDNGTDHHDRDGSRPTLDGKRQWSITDDGERVPHRKSDAKIVAQSDIARVRALFICSGVKAKEINRRAYVTRSSPPDFLARAAATANRKLFPVPHKEEHVLAARMLMRELESSTQALTVSTQNFRNKAIKELTESISSLRSRIDSDLMSSIFEGGDTAVRITSEISGQGPLQVKQITDDIDRMLRARRRRMRWIRGFGWMMVEWALVAFMWCLWLIVVLVGSVKRVFGFGWGIVRWLLWL